jgi:NADP-reducing hydrogenase subunit HndB
MARINREELEKTKQRHRALVTVREGTARASVVVHMGPCGIAAGARPVLLALIRELEARDTSDVVVTISDCAGMCSQEPVVSVYCGAEQPVVYGKVSEETAKEIFIQHVLGGKVLDRLKIEEGTGR